MKKLVTALGGLTAALLSNVLLAHPGHGLTGFIGHDMQHALWNFAAMIVLGALIIVAMNLSEKNGQD